MTSDLEILRWQHEAAEEMAANIVASVGAYRDEYDAIPIARLIGSSTPCCGSTSLMRIRSSTRG